VLYPGLMAVARLIGLPLALHEIGASAGLNLVLDRYAYALGGRSVGDPGSALRLGPAWEGPDPAGTPPVVATRRGCDVAPLDVTRAGDRRRLEAYVWADQDDRRARLAAALDIARADPPAVDRADAADWVERWIAPEPPAGVARVLMHSFAFQYLPDGARRRIAGHMAAAGARARPDAPLAWLAFRAARGARPAPDASALARRRWDPPRGRRPPRPEGDLDPTLAGRTRRPAGSVGALGDTVGVGGPQGAARGPAAPGGEAVDGDPGIGEAAAAQAPGAVRQACGRPGRRSRRVHVFTRPWPAARLPHRPGDLSSQSSQRSPATRVNSPRFPVTTTRPRVRAWPAIIRS
jgi:hypothetical protein